MTADSKVREVADPKDCYLASEIADIEEMEEEAKKVILLRWRLFSQMYWYYSFGRVIDTTD